ncbi:MAG: hypothetical protein LBK53_08855 [Heliobacteriaceae bacterium]|jgi:hypothetical protein|nr:hypothetical protein [Heliobacteriaceae bacterium]
MANFNSLKKLCNSLGKNNDPAYAVMAIALVKGICRPMFTMMDKTEDPETKKYTAIREGLTEVIAIPTYFALSRGMAGLSKKMPQALQSKSKENLMFLGVCVAALFVIPALCSIAIKPLMEKIKKKNTNPKPVTAYNSFNSVDKPRLHTFYNRPQYGMKVGGV